MTFLAPATGLIAAALAVPALLALYFLKLRRRPLRVSSTMLWEQAAQDLQVNVPLRWLRWSVVLVLQLLALGCLLVALARPAVGEGAQAGARVVIIVDRSASMNAADAGPSEADGVPQSRLDLAKRRAVELIDALGRAGGGAGAGRPRAMIVAMAAESRALTGFTSDLRELRDAVRAIEPTDQPDDLAAAVRLVEAMTAQAGDESEQPPPPTVYLISDGGTQALAPQDRRGVTPRLIYAGPPRPPHTPAADPRVDNVGVVAVSARRDPDDGALVRVFARVQNAGPTEVAVAVRCTVDGVLPAEGVAGVTIPGAAVNDEGGIDPGEAPVVFNVRPGTAISDQIVVVSINRADVLAADDAAGVVLPPHWRPRILVVAPDTPSGAEAAPAHPDIFLIQALEATEPALLRTTTAGAFNAAAPPGAGARPWLGFDLVVFDRTEPVVLPPLPTLSIGAGLTPAGLSIGPSDDGGGGARVLAWRRDHPVLRYVGLDTLVVAPPTRLELPPDDAQGERRVSILVDGTHGPLVAEIEEGRRPGRVVRRLAIAFELARSNWGPDVSFPVFIANAVERLTQGDDRPREMAWSVTTSERIAVTALPDAREVRVTGAWTATFPLAPAADGASATGLIGPLERAGVYRLETDSGQPATPAQVAVNLASERESLLAGNPPTPPTAPASPTEAAADGLDPGAPALEGGAREVWHWFALAALGLLAIEWFVYAWRMRA